MTVDSLQTYVFFFSLGRMNEIFFFLNRYNIIDCVVIDTMYVCELSIR